MKLRDLKIAQRGGEGGIYRQSGVAADCFAIILLSQSSLLSQLRHMTFRLQNAKYVLLTYAQCGDLDPWKVSDHLSTLGAECIVGRESHADDGVHLHVFADFGREFSSRRTNVFDVGGYHPNIERVGKTPWKAYDYAIKDGDVVAGGAERPLEPSGKSGRTSDSTWSRILQAESAEEFFSLCAELAPEHYVRSFGSIQRYVDWRYRPVVEPYRTPEGIGFSIEGVEGLVEFVSQARLGSGPLAVRYVCTTSCILRSFLASERQKGIILGAALGLRAGASRLLAPLPRGLGGAPHSLLYSV